VELNPNKSISTAPILRTKLTPPVPGGDDFPLERVLASLNAGLQIRVLLVTAPAGFGKTACLAEFTLC